MLNLISFSAILIFITFYLSSEMTKEFGLPPKNQFGIKLFFFLIILKDHISAKVRMKIKKRKKDRNFKLNEVLNSFLK